MGINLLYSTGAVDPSLNYWFSGPRYHDPEDLVNNPDIEIKDGLRIFEFSGSASQVVSVMAISGSCLLVMDPYYALLPDISSKLPFYGELTDQSLIGETAAESNQLSKIIDTRPQNVWCYYFEKGDLAQSKGKMQEAVDYYEEASSKNLKPLEAVEYLPFVKAYAALGKIDIAVDLTASAFKKSGSAKAPICQLWKDILAQNPDIPLTSVESVYNSGNCTNLLP